MNAALRMHHKGLRVCTHVERDHLGSEEGAYFSRCRACQSVIIVQREHLWTLRSSTAQEDVPDD